MHEFYSDNYVKEFMIIINKMFITSLMAVASLVATSLLLKKEKNEMVWFVPKAVYQLLITALTVIILYVGGLLEVKYQAFHYFNTIASRNMVAITYNAIFILSLLFFTRKNNKQEFILIPGIISTLFLVVFLYSLSTVYATSIDHIIDGTSVRKSGF